MKYEHTQTGYVIIFFLLIITILYGIILIQSDFVNPIEFWIMNIIIFIIISFTYLKVTIDRQYLRIKFGYGLFRKKFNLEEIISARIVKNHWYYGWGIRLWMFRPMWIFSVSGFDAVEIELKNGKIYRIGTDDPKGLESVLKRH
ncbi:MAG: hypothetical protein U9P50_01135 [Patescibacteria group bacterium]|nr:hypothetical protein [Patescibacteria group bacterium]